MRFVETHCHLDYLKAFPLEEILSKAKDGHVEKMITISVEPDNFSKVLDIAHAHSNVFCTQGVHPHDATLLTDEALASIKKNATDKKVVAVGEIGLDYYYKNSPIEDQKSAFEKQLQAAVDLDLPVVVHSRDADEDTIRILKNFSKTLMRKGVIHSFTSGKGLAEFCLSEGFCLGFNGIITFKNAQNVRDIVDITPIERILYETDSPFLTPVPHRGKENGPYFLPFVAQKIAELKGVDAAELHELVYQTTHKVFFKLV